MSRYAASCLLCHNQDPGCPVQVVVGWDSRRETYFAQVEDYRVEEADPETGLVLWVGRLPNEVRTVRELEAAIRRWATIPRELQDQLDRDRLDDPFGATPAVAGGQRWFRRRGYDIYVELADDEVTDEQDKAWFRERGLHWARHYSAVVPDGEYGSVSPAELEPVPAAEVEYALASWRRSAGAARPPAAPHRSGLAGLFRRSRS